MSAQRTLMHVMPKAGFSWALGGNRVTTRPQHDMSVQAALRAADTPFNRPSVVSELVDVFDIATVNVADPGGTALYDALSVTQRVISWAAQLPPAVFAELVMSICAARRLSLEEHGVDMTDDGTWGQTLAQAVDAFDDAVHERGWGGGRGLRALGGHAGEDDDEGTELGRLPVEEETDICEEFDGMELDREESGEAEQMEGVEKMEEMEK